MHNSLIIKILALNIIYLLCSKLNAQEVEGLWVGYLKTKGSNVHYEILITKEKDNYTGYALSLMVIDGVENIGVKTVKLKLKNKVLLIEDDNLVYNNFKTPAKKTKLIARLYTKEGSDSLTGTFNTRSLDFTDRTSYEGDLELIRSSDKSNSYLFIKLAHLNLINNNAVAVNKAIDTVTENQATGDKEIADPIRTDIYVNSKTKTTNIESAKNSALIKPDIENNKVAGIKVFDPFENRKIEIIETVFVSLDSVTIALYDNGIVDGDTVSIYVNGKLHLEKKQLGTTAILSTIYFPTTLVDSLELIMYAENLGTIPPNTGLLVIQDGNARHEIRFSGDLQKNAAVILRRKK